MIQEEENRMWDNYSKGIPVFKEKRWKGMSPERHGSFQHMKPKLSKGFYQ